MPHFWCGVMKFSSTSATPVVVLVQHILTVRVDRRTVGNQSLAEIDHPRVILIQLLTAGQRAPWNIFMHVGIASVVANMLGFKAAPGRRADNLARLRLNIAEADFSSSFGKARCV
jgi:hypothetical protein